MVRAFDHACLEYANPWIRFMRIKDPIQIINAAPNKFVFIRQIGLILKELTENLDFKELLEKIAQYKIENYLTNLKNISKQFPESTLANLRGYLLTQIENKSEEKNSIVAEQGMKER